ncbi:MAG: alpha/beta hydrolase [Coraliomargaritaceae bacterium]
MIQRTYFIAALLSLSSLLFSPFALCSAQEYPPVIQNAAELTYKKVDGYDLKLWVFNPEGIENTKPPAMLFFFGGGWYGGSPTQFVRQCQHLAKRGMVGIVADYRVKSRQGVLAKSCVEDALDALRYVNQNADKIGIDPERIGVGGGSAGGHLAASLGTIHANDVAAPKAMALYNPATVLAPIPTAFAQAILPKQRREMMNAEIKEREGELRNRLGAEPLTLSPFHHVSASCPPAILFHGTNDKTVPYESTLLFSWQLKANGVSHTLKTYENAGHGFFNREPYYSQTTEQLDQFLVSLGWLQ